MSRTRQYRKTKSNAIAGQAGRGCMYLLYLCVIIVFIVPVVFSKCGARILVWRNCGWSIVIKSCAHMVVSPKHVLWTLRVFCLTSWKFIWVCKALREASGSLSLVAYSLLARSIGRIWHWSWIWFDFFLSNWACAMLLRSQLPQSYARSCPRCWCPVLRRALCFIGLSFPFWLLIKV